MTTNNPFMPNASTAAPAPAASTPMPGATSHNSSADSFEVDLSGVQSGFTIPEGVYRVRCVEIEQSVSSKGNPQFVWDFVVVGGTNDGFKLKLFTALTPAAMWKVAEAVTALGVGQQGQVVKFRRSDVLNKECGALIETTEYNGNNRSTISNLMSLSDMNDRLAEQVR